MKRKRKPLGRLSFLNTFLSYKFKPKFTISSIALSFILFDIVPRSIGKLFHRFSLLYFRSYISISSSIEYPILQLLIRLFFLLITHVFFFYCFIHREATQFNLDLILSFLISFSPFLCVFLFRFFNPLAAQFYLDPILRFSIAFSHNQILFLLFFSSFSCRVLLRSYFSYFF